MARRGVKPGVLWSRGRQWRELEITLRGRQEVGIVSSRCNRPLSCSGNLCPDLSELVLLRFGFTFQARKVLYRMVESRLAHRTEVVGAVVRSDSDAGSCDGARCEGEAGRNSERARAVAAALKFSGSWDEGCLDRSLEGLTGENSEDDDRAPRDRQAVEFEANRGTVLEALDGPGRDCL